MLCFTKKAAACQPIRLLIALWALAVSSAPLGADDLSTIYGQESAETDQLEVAPQVALPFTITLKPEFEATRGRIYLGEISTCDGYNPGCEEIQGIDLGSAPAPGRMQTIRQDEIVKILKKEIQGAEISIQGAPYTRIKAEARDLDLSVVREALEGRIATINEHLQEVTLSLKQLSVLRRAKLRPGEFQLEFPLIDHAELISDEWAIVNLNGSLRLDLLVLVEGERRPENVPVRAHIEASRVYPVAVRELKKGTTLSNDDFRLEPRRVLNTGRSYVSDLKLLVGKTLKSSLRVGEVPREGQLAVPTLVKRGQTVDLKMQNGKVQLEGRGKALGSGGMGEKVDVIYSATNKKFSGKVIGESLIEVRF